MTVLGERRAVPAFGASTRPAVRALAVAVFGCGMVLVVAVLGLPKSPLAVAATVWLATVAWDVSAPWRSHLVFVRDWWLPMALLQVYTGTRGLADRLGVPVHVQMPIDVDQWLGGGRTPTARLQQAWCEGSCATSPPQWFDTLFTGVYLSHFVVGMALAGVLWVRNREEWLRWMRRYLGIFFGALTCYLVYPMAPPWLAARSGALAEDVVRTTSRGWVGELPRQLHEAAVGTWSNPVAAMPSLHAGLAFLVAGYAIGRLRGGWRWLLLGYPLAMSLALVYMGEHYVIDIVAGAVLAGIVTVLCRAWERRARMTSCAC